MMSVLKHSCSLLILIVIVSSVFVSWALAIDGDSAAFAIQQADEKMVSAYQAVREAEAAGADISGFSELLNDAAQLLAQAHTSFRAGDFDSAVRFSNLTTEMGKEVEVKADRLRDLQRGLPVWQMWLTMVKSLFAVLVIMLMSFWAWRVFKRFYYRQMGDMQPQVISDES